MVILHKNTEYSVFTFYTEKHYLGLFVTLLLFYVGIRWGKAYNDIRRFFGKILSRPQRPYDGCGYGMNNIKK